MDFGQLWAFIPTHPCEICRRHPAEEGDFLLQFASRGLRILEATTIHASPEEISFFFFSKKIPPLRPPLTAVPVPTTGGRPAPASCRYAWPSSSAPPPPLRPPRAAAPPRRRRSSPPRSDAAAGASSSSPRHAARRRAARPYSRLAPRRSRWRSAPRPPSPSPTASATVSPLPIHLYV